jgi:hypothetical protein
MIVLNSTYDYDTLFSSKFDLDANRWLFLSSATIGRSQKAVVYLG